MYHRLYETCIEYGAQPNLSGIVVGGGSTPVEGGFLLKQFGLTSDRRLIEFGLKTVFDVGYLVAGITTYILDQEDIVGPLVARLSKLQTNHNDRILEQDS
jgi:hypothetical protein